MAFPYIFAALAGDIAAADLDANFNACAFASDLTALTVVVAALPSNTIPLAPTPGGSAGVSAALSRVDHRHPPQPASTNLQTGTTYTLAATDDGMVVELSNAAPIALTVPNSLPVGFSCLLVQVGAGQVTIAAGAGATQRSYSSFNKTAGQWAEATLYVRTNSGGSSAEYVIGGTLA